MDCHRRRFRILEVHDLDLDERRTPSVALSQTGIGDNGGGLMDLASVQNQGLNPHRVHDHQQRRL